MDRQARLNLNTGMADEAIKLMKELNAAAPDKQLFSIRDRREHRRHSRRQSGSKIKRAKFDMALDALRE